MKLRFILLLISLGFPLSLLATPKEDLAELQSKANALFGNRAAAEVSVVDKLESGALSATVPEYDPKTHMLKIKIRITKKGLADPLVMAENYVRLGHIQGMMTGTFGPTSTFNGPFEWAETVANARAGSLNAREMLLRMEAEVSKEVAEQIERKTVIFEKNEARYKALAKEKVTRTQKSLAEASSAAKLDRKKKEAAWEKRKQTFTKLEKDELKFDDLVMKNDRKGVRKMLETYLPWELMEPSEVKQWKMWLEAMEKPDKNKALVLFRGLDSNPYLKPRDGGAPGLLSSVLIKNQGNYTRRLRSLTTLRDKIGVAEETLNYGPKLLDDVPHLSTMMHNHAQNPVGSPFLSVSDFSVARGFGHEEMVAIRLDERRIIPNMFGVNGERERLIPLVVFPDEIIHYQDFQNGNGTQEAFLKTVEKKLGRKMTTAEIGKVCYDQCDDFAKKAMDKFPEVIGNVKKKCAPLLSALNHLLQ